jgi:hypothetical protein
MQSLKVNKFASLHEELPTLINSSLKGIRGYIVIGQPCSELIQVSKGYELYVVIG